MDVRVKQFTERYVDILYLAGRGCFGLENLDSTLHRDKLDFIRKLIANGHESILEHGIISIQIIGCSRSFMSQITRHRLVSFSIKSQHYVDHSNFWVKDLETDIEEAQIIYAETIQTIRNRYRQLVNEFKVPIHVAREILPNACLTNIFMTTNFREWRHIIRLRQTPNNTYEMAKFGQKIKRIFKQLIPGVFDDL